MVLKPRIAVSGLAGVYVLRAMGLASLIALAVAVAPTSALAQFVCGGSATGAEVQTGGGATATGANATACGGAPIANAPLVTNASAFGAFANATGRSDHGDWRILARRRDGRNGPGPRLPWNPRQRDLCVPTT